MKYPLLGGVNMIFSGAKVNIGVNEEARSGYSLIRAALQNWEE